MINQSTISSGFHCLHSFCQRSCNRSFALSGIQTLILAVFLQHSHVLQSKVVYIKRIRKCLLYTKLFGKKNQLISPSNESFSSKSSIYLTCSKYVSDGCLSFQIILGPCLPSFPIPVSCASDPRGSQ